MRDLPASGYCCSWDEEVVADREADALQEPTAVAPEGGGGAEWMVEGSIAGASRNVRGRFGHAEDHGWPCGQDADGWCEVGGIHIKLMCGLT